MAASVNKMILVGNLGKTPELKHTNSGKSTCTLAVATTETWKDSEGNKQSHTEWTDVVLWGKQAENACKYLSKGRPVFIEGRKRTRVWEDKDGIKRYAVECVANDVQYLGSKGDSSGDSSKDEDESF